MIAVRALFAEAVHPSESRRDNPVVLDLDAGRVKIAQFFIGTATVVIGLIGLLSAPSEEYDGIGVVIVVLVSLTTFPVSLRWFIGGWPTPKALVAYVVYADVSIGACLLLKQDLLTAIGGTVLFAVVTMFAVIAVRPLVYWMHMAATVLVLAIVCVRAALNDAASVWVVAAHSLTMLLMFAAPMILVIYVSELRSRAQESLVDPLTGLRNRRGLFAAVEAIFLSSQKDRAAEMSVVVLDVDGMKHVNDTFGHHTGDAVLVDLAQHLRAVTANEWVVARLGGDEFACVSVAEPGTMEPRIEALMAALSGRRVISGLTVSVGSASTETQIGGSEQAVLHLLQTADAEMYRAKSARRQTDYRGTAPG
ncbi:GGDEF domain-containing protein [Rhodococcus sp. Leaf278]|uniref:GGDEF domain-containing protein n=1 Tax=Rhodococcus sp. Leaf278 TaxID=1736319 RepID=UPI000A6CF208|nr:GGDEF domain-containing protein [Rhodococcus sp. Leaf278]